MSFPLFALHSALTLRQNASFYPPFLILVFHRLCNSRARLRGWKQNKTGVKSRKLPRHSAAVSRTQEAEDQTGTAPKPLFRRPNVRQAQRNTKGMDEGKGTASELSEMNNRRNEGKNREQGGKNNALVMD